MRSVIILLLLFFTVRCEDVSTENPCIICGPRLSIEFDDNPLRYGYWKLSPDRNEGVTEVYSIEPNSFNCAQEYVARISQDSVFLLDISRSDFPIADGIIWSIFTIYSCPDSTWAEEWEMNNLNELGSEATVQIISSIRENSGEFRIVKISQVEYDSIAMR